MASGWFGGPIPADSDNETDPAYTFIQDYLGGQSVSPGTGTITAIECYGHAISAAGIFAIFTKAGTTYTGTGNSGALAIAVGLNQFAAPTHFTAFSVAAGQYAGFFNMTLERLYDAAADMWYYEGNGTTSAHVYATAAGRVHMFRFYVTETPAGLSIPVVEMNYRRRRKS